MKRAKKPRKRHPKTKRNAPPVRRETAAGSTVKSILFGKMPGALMYRTPYPPGVPDTHSTQSAHLHAVAAGAAFGALPADEREALFESISKTFRRSEYHRLRYEGLRQTLDERRRDMPGDVFWDEFAEMLHFELQAFCGAARMMLDEIVYLVARRHGVAPNKARRSPWETADLIKKPLPPACDVEEIRLARKEVAWFELLNGYRNSFFHHGWRHGTGHFSQDDMRQAARNPAANALLVPDLSSLGGRSKPHERTYAEGTTVDDVMRSGKEGLDRLLRELCERAWNTPRPAAGKLPRAEHPNILVTLARPAIYVIHDLVVIPLFTTEKAARAFGSPGETGVELIELPVSSSVIGQPAISFTLRGIDQLELPQGTSGVRVLVDPVAKDSTYRDIRCSAALDVEIARAIAEPTDPTDPISVRLPGGRGLFAWCGTEARDWA